MAKRFKSIFFGAVVPSILVVALILGAAFVGQGGAYAASKKPFQYDATFNQPANASFGFPDGKAKRLSVEFASAGGKLPTGKIPVVYIINKLTTDFQTTANHYIPLSKVGSYGGSDYFAGATPMKLRSDRVIEEQVYLILQIPGHAPGDTVDFTISISGYLE